MKILKSVIVPFSAEKMFNLVDSCEDYPKFLQWCNNAEIIERNEHITCAKLFIDYKLVKSDFTTRNNKKFPEKMEINLVDGPFKSLFGSWNFLALNENACKINFEFNYEFSNIIFEKIIGKVFSLITNSLVESFIKRAKELYKK